MVSRTTARTMRLDHETGFDPEGVEVLCFPSPRFERSWPAMYEIRKEKRNPEKLRVLLAQMADPFLTEPASTDNVSSHGMRVRTEVERDVVDSVANRTRRCFW